MIQREFLEELYNLRSKSLVELDKAEEEHKGPFLARPGNKELEKFETQVSKQKVTDYKKTVDVLNNLIDLYWSKHQKEY